MSDLSVVVKDGAEDMAKAGEQAGKAIVEHFEGIGSELENAATRYRGAEEAGERGFKNLLEGGGQQAETTASEVGHASASAGSATAESSGAEVTEAGVESAGVSSAETAGTDPVDVVSGQLLESTTDVALPGVLSLLLRRTYASGYKHGALMGPGWSSTVDIRLLVGDDGDVRFLGDDAQTLEYGVPAGLRLGLPVYPANGPRWVLGQDRADGALTVTDPESGMTYRFAAHGAVRPLTEITDRNRNSISFLRDSDGRPLAIEHSGGYRLATTLADTPTGPRLTGYVLLSSENASPADGPVRLVGFEYDQAGRLSRVLDAFDAAQCYEWNAQDRISAWIDASGYRYPYRYDDAGRVVETGEHGGIKHASISYDPAARITHVTDALGHTRAYHYDRFQQITKVVDPLGAEILLHKDRYGRLLAHVDPLGNQTTVDIDADGNPRVVHRADGSEISYVFDGAKRPVRMSLPGGSEWRYTYDSAGNPLTITDPTGAVTMLEYDEHGALSQVSEPDGARRRIENNAAGLPMSITGPDGAVTRVERDALGRVRSVTGPGGAIEEFSWSANGRLLFRRARDGSESRYAYDLCGNVVEAHGPGGTVTFDYGPFNQLRARTGRDGSRYKFTHDAELRLTSVTGPTGLTWNYQFDAGGNLVEERDFNGRVMAYSHDSAGRLTGKTNGAGQQVTYTRDPLGRVTGYLAEQQSTIFEYDNAGNLVRAADPAGVLEYERDPLGRVLSEGYQGRTLARRFDATGRMISRETPAGQRSCWEYDTAGLPRALLAGEHEVTFTHDANGRETSRKLGPDTTLSQNYELSGRLETQSLTTSDQVIVHRAYRYSPDGAPSEITDLLRGAVTYTTDQASRITAVNAANWSETYAYDELGNVAYAQHPTPREDSTVLGEREHSGTLVRRAGRTHFDYDAQGRLIGQSRRTLSGQMKRWSYTWNAHDQLTSVTAPDGTVWQYTYDPLGRRRAKARRGEDGAIIEQTVFTWDGSRLAEQEHHCPDGNVETLTWDWEPASHRAAAQRRTNSTQQRSAGTTGPQPASAVENQSEVDAEFWAIVTDQLGTPRELVTPDGRLSWTDHSTVWGNRVGPSDAAEQRAVDCPLRYPGQYYDTETGLHYNQFRYHNPATGSYLSPDPSGCCPGPTSTRTSPTR